MNRAARSLVLACLVTGAASAVHAIEAESYTARSSNVVGPGACTDVTAATCLLTRPNEWTSYANVNFTGKTSIEVRQANAFAVATLELRLNSAGGTLLGSCSMPLTGGWNTFTTVSCPISSASGNQTLVLVFKTDFYANLNWFNLLGGGATPTATATATATATTATATATATATSTTSSSATATATSTSTATATATGTATATPTACSGCKKVVGYFEAWGHYQRGYWVKNIHTSGSAAKLTHINYAFANVQNNQCVVGVTQTGVGDAFADYTMAITAANSVDGVADQAQHLLRGHWGQLKKLKQMYPHLKVLIGLGGWTWSNGFSSAARPENRAAFVSSCIDAFIHGNLPAVDGAGGPGVAANLFDGIDVDWEYPAACGLQCGPPEDTQNFTGLMAEFRTQLDTVRPGLLLTGAFPAGNDKYSKIELNIIHNYMSFINLMTYDFHGAWDPTTNLMSPLFSASDDPTPAYNTNFAVQGYKSAGFPASKIVMGVPFYGRGWAQVPNVNNGLYQPGVAAPSSYTPTGESGFEDYPHLLALEPSYAKFRHAQAQTVWIFNGNTFWSYDDPISQTNKGVYIKNQSLAGAMFWALTHDTSSGTLINALWNGLQ